MKQKATENPEYQYLLKEYKFAKNPQRMNTQPKGKKAYYFMATINKEPIKVLLDEGASTNVIGYDLAKEYKLLNLLPKNESPIKNAQGPGGKLLKNYGKIEVLFQVDDYAEYIKISIIEGNQPYMLLSEADQARFKISKDREGRIATINGKPINYQDVDEY
ncbi:6214_t:CDS:1 [Ambispora leptoticha]|uniref:6214_t:CDS:1 n=1 Tax=Ambispora leptoticha TaxID=144679 RepID=A0A9N9C6A6_9GLOM|nr:6214_t:CDS:1 [Ambispora leptoticha]